MRPQFRLQIWHGRGYFSSLSCYWGYGARFAVARRAPVLQLAEWDHGLEMDLVTLKTLVLNVAGTKGTAAIYVC